MNIIKCLGAAVVILTICLILSGGGYDTCEAPKQLHTITVEDIPPYEYVYYDIPLTEEQQRYVQRTAEENNVPYEIVLGVMYVESRYRADAVGDSGDSVGIMQVQPKWHGHRMERLGVTDLTDPMQCAAVGIDILGEKIAQYGNLEKALVAYNAGRPYAPSTEYSRKVVDYAQWLAESTFKDN